MMRLALVILRKDLRRLWWEAAVGLITLAALTYYDALRYDFVPGPTEAMLNFLVPAVWAYIVAMLVYQEALVGDRQFWLTRPYPRGALLIAKLLAVILLIHLPALVSDCLILWSHDFSPVRYLPELAWKQAVIAGVLVLPALAIAAVTRNLPQFAFAAAMSVLAGALLLGTVEPFSAPWIRQETVRRIAALGVACAGAAIVLAIQYISRRTALARAVVMVTAAAAMLLFIYLPTPELAYAGALKESGTISVSLAPPGRRSDIRQFPGPIRRISLPVEMSGTPGGSNVRFEQVRLQIKTAGGLTWTMKRRGIPPGLHGSISREFQTLFVPHEIFERAVRDPVTIEAALAAVLYENPTATIPSRSKPVAVPGLGMCMSGIVDPSLFRVMCESPDSVPRAGVHLRHGLGILGRAQLLGDSAPVLRYPLTPWLSPLNRRQTFFHLRDSVPPGPGNEWLVPAEALAEAEVVLQPMNETRRILSHYRLGPLRLADYLAP